MADIIRQKGSAAFGTRLRRLSERLDREVEAIYRANGVDFQPRWFPVVTALAQQEEASVGELAAMIGITHAAISQVRGELIAAGLIRTKADRADKRRQLLALSAKGQRYAGTLAPLWRAIAAATDGLLAEGAPSLLEQMGKLEAALDAQSMIERVGVVKKTTKKMAKKMEPKKHASAD
jgi:DNA-binding MarR family transcriptional regulator